VVLEVVVVADEADAEASMTVDVEVAEVVLEEAVADSMIVDAEVHVVVVAPAPTVEALETSKARSRPLLK
jgi:hypothetical protein